MYYLRITGSHAGCVPFHEPSLKHVIGRPEVKLYPAAQAYVTDDPNDQFPATPTVSCISPWSMFGNAAQPLLKSKSMHQSNTAGFWNK